MIFFKIAPIISLKVINLNYNVLIAIITIIFAGLGLMIGARFGMLCGMLALAATMPIVLIELFFEKMWTEVNRLDGLRREATQMDSELDKFA